MDTTTFTRPAKLVTALVAATAATLLCVGCQSHSSAAASPASEPTANAISTRPTPSSPAGDAGAPSAGTDSGKAANTVPQKNDAASGSSTQSDTGGPTELPAYPGAATNWSGYGSKGEKTPDSIDKVSAYYRHALQTAGWHLTLDSKYSEWSTTLTGTRGSQGATVTISKDGSGSLISASSYRV
ncbi:hypothetical protein ACFCXT_30500 [Streptomyces vinaceus]|uniref:hypothetical protein n=1 Tax=Streptomyces vinaceus TaxID=1960 RepID=UPI0035DED395